MSKSPAFQFYVQDFLLGTLDFTAEEVGGYIRLLCYQWDRGSVPDDPKKIMQMTGIKSKSLNAILSKFQKNCEGNLVNVRLEKERDKQAKNREIAVESGKEGARKRWGGHRVPYTNPNGVDMAFHTSSSISTSVSSSEGTTTPQPQSGGNASAGNDQRKNSKEKKVSRPRVTFRAPELSEVLMYFRELKGMEWDEERIVRQSNRWFDYYTANGWRVGKNPMKDWKAAVRNWIKNDFDNGNRHNAGTVPNTASKASSRGATVDDLQALKRNTDTGPDERAEFADIEIVE